MIKKNDKIGVIIPEILLPAEDIDMTKWSVVACDQYTSQPEYWKAVEQFVDNSPSTLNLIFPEVYLEDSDKEERIGRINGNMQDYLNKSTLIPQKPGFIFIDRRTSHAESRKGLVIAVDLERYDYGKRSQTLIRATEGTVLDRLPPRIKIRENAPIELPHIMLLIDDPGKTVIEPLAACKESLEKLYDFDLMMNGMHIEGYRVDDEKLLSGIISALENLALPEAFHKKYGISSDKGVLLFAAGDGNHSLASAKAYWENLKKTLSKEEFEMHPARYALVEVVNVHDEGLTFEPIHRIVFNVNFKAFLDDMLEYFDKNNVSNEKTAFFKVFDSRSVMEMELALQRNRSDVHLLPFTAEDLFGVFTVKNPLFNLEVGTLQAFLDEYVKSNPAVRIDYIHGEDVVDSLGSKEGNIGFYLPQMDKRDLFKTVILDGALPRKTFSMGEAEEKRFYLECRKIS